MSANQHDTILIDIDGTILEEFNSMMDVLVKPHNILPGVVDRFKEWRKKGYYIVITTARPNCLKRHTEKKLTECGLVYDRLIMNLTSGHRHLINNAHDESNSPTAFAYTVGKNQGLLDLVIKEE